MPSVELITVKKVAALLTVSVRTVWRMRREKLLPAPVRVRGGVRWKQDELCEWIRLRRTGSLDHGSRKD